MKRTIIIRSIVIAVVLGTLTIIILGLLQPAQSSTGQHISIQNVGTQKGNAAPNFTLSTPEGKKVSLSDYRGKVVMLNFWYIGCDSCVVEMPGLQKVYAAQQAAGSDFVILGINVADSASAIAQFTRQQGFTYPMVLDKNLTIEQLYRVNGTPTSFFIDRRGLVYSSIVGPIDEATLNSTIAQLRA